ncbi:hypothetical protein HK102_009702 [Quaeritorhiza haematococci]|nr:hypothetical protein HK102_009702 [Quaeritorhiza haematococci]
MPSEHGINNDQVVASGNANITEENAVAVKSDAIESMEDLLARHRKEKKDLTAHCMALKKSVGKGAADKKKKKEVQDTITKLEQELAERHEREKKGAEEREQQQPSSSSVVDSVSEGVESISLQVDEEQKVESDNSSSAAPAPTTPGKKKPNRQQLRKERKAAKMEEMRRQAEEEAANTVNMKDVEDKAIHALIKPMGFSIQEDYKHLRRLASNYMRQHPDDFLPFLLTDQGDLYTPGK